MGEATPERKRETNPCTDALMILKKSHDLNAAPLSNDSRPRLVNLQLAAHTLGVSTKTLRRLVSAGDLKHVRIGRCVRVPATELDRLVGEVARGK